MNTIPAFLNFAAALLAFFSRHAFDASYTKCRSLKYAECRAQYAFAAYAVPPSLSPYIGAVDTRVRAGFTLLSDADITKSI